MPQQAGSNSGPLTYRLNAGVSALDGANLHWFKSAGLHPYPAGWPTGITTDLLGAKYDPTISLSSFTATDTDGNAQLTLLDGGLASPGLLKAVNLSLGPKVSVLQSGPDQLNLAIKSTDGTLTGSFMPPGATKSAKIRGVIFPAQSAIFGSFIGASEVGSLTITPADHPLTAP